ncbi:MAG: zinc transporter ZupT [Nanoarchaeota archaeon]|nr:zinc transporter ZupT [Nanoarchaeota archaeon]MBU1029945.1 zinc transporter ZupT [Nanoarchaeota archaeon]MBU1849232.1 zinc transporter ZupT [Nanoarchaeota archaeon]
MINALILTTLAGLSTVLGSLIIFFIKKRNDCFLSIAMGFAAGVMIFISLTELLNESISNIGYLYAIISFFAGILLIYVIDVFIPHSYEAENACSLNLKDKHGLKRCGLIVALGIAIHNFPEGITVFFSSMVNFKLGIIVALGIALHNIPEGIAIAMPIYYATNSKIKAFWYSFLSGLAEPLGAIIAFLFLRNFLTNTLLNVILAATAGIMVFISFDELLPYAYKQKNNHITIAGIFLGMAMMALSLVFL